MFGRQREYRCVLRGSSLMRRQSVWLGPDHLLLVSAYYIVEQYRRFFYRDIQALVIQRTVAWIWWLGVMALFLVPSLGGLLWLALRDGTFTDQLIGSIPLGIIAVWSGLAFLFGLIGGPSCRCIIQTSAGTEVLEPVSTLRKARKLLRKLEPQIVAAQPPLTDEEQRAAIVLADAPPPPLAVRVAAPPPPPGAAPAPYAPDRWSRATFTALAIFAAMQATLIFVSNVALAVFDNLIYAAVVVSGVVALIRQNRRVPASTLRGWIWAALGTSVPVILASYVQMIAYAFHHPEDAGNFWSMFAHDAARSGLEDPLKLGICLAIGVTCGAVGVLGLLAVRRDDAAHGAGVANRE